LTAIGMSSFRFVSLGGLNQQGWCREKLPVKAIKSAPTLIAGVNPSATA
jgi:hypothetical protein